MPRSAKKPIRLVTRQEKRAEGVVASLESMLAEARAGDITGVAIAAVYRDGATRVVFEAGDNIATLIGSLDRVKSRLLNHWPE